jgi:energy-coupling factor transport system substrate-specific component
MGAPERAFDMAGTGSDTPTPARAGLTARDLITTGVFIALFFAVTMVGGIFTAPNPVLTFAMPATVALLTGPVYLLLIAKVPKRGPVTILGAVMGLLMFVTGMYWLWAVAYLVCGIAADLIAGAGRFTNRTLNVVSFLVFSLNPLGSYLMLWLNADAYAGYLVGKGTDRAYMDTMIASGTGWVLPAMIVGIIVCGLASALLGQWLLRRQFEKAGVTAGVA